MPQVMHYPTYEPSGVPKLMHYGLFFEISGEPSFKFDKHWHYELNIANCAPWNLTDPKKLTGGVFPHPPHPKDLQSKVGLCIREVPDDCAWMEDARACVCKRSAFRELSH